MVRFAGALLASALWFMLACDRAAPASGSVRDPSSSKAADSSPTGPAADPPVQWELVEEWRVGGEARGPHSFDYNLGIALLPDGNLLHLDYQASQLHVLDTLGKPVRSFGNKGSGPGEIAGANGFAVAPDGRIVVNDLAGRRFVVFSPIGEFERTVRIAAPRGMGGRWQPVVLRDGRLIETVAPHMNERPRGAGEPVTLAWAADLSHADTLQEDRCSPGSATARGATIALRNPDRSVAAEMPIPFTTPEIATAYDASGGWWGARTAGSSEIVQRSFDGCAITATIRLAGARAPMADFQREQIVQRVTDEARRWKAVAPAVDDLPREQPWYRSIRVDGEGRVWVERMLAPGSLAVDVFESNGQPIARIGRDLPQSPVFAGTRVYGLVRDSDDVSHLVAWRVRPR